MTTAITRPIKPTEMARAENGVAARPKAAVATVPWKTMAPSEWAVLRSMLWNFDERRDLPARLSGGNADGYVKTSVQAALLAMHDAKTAVIDLEQESHMWGLYTSHKPFISKGPRDADWPAGSVEARLQALVSTNRQEVKTVVSRYVGDRRESPTTDMWKALSGRMKQRGFIVEHKDKDSFLFFSWDSTNLWVTAPGKETYIDYVETARDVGIGTPLEAPYAYGIERQSLRESVRTGIDSAVSEKTEYDED